jgi:hypothetical protein
METATVKKQEIHFDQHVYELYLKKWEQRTVLKKAIQHKLEQFFPAMKINVDSLYPHPEQNIYKLVSKQFVQSNPMGLSGYKLAEIKEMNFAPLLNNEMFEYGKLFDMKKPTKADFTDYAETPEEVEKLEDSWNFIKALNKLSGKETYTMYEQMHIFTLIKKSIRAGRNSELLPCASFIKK